MHLINLCDTGAKKLLNSGQRLDGAAKINTGEFCNIMHFVLVGNRVVGGTIGFDSSPTRVDFSTLKLMDRLYVKKAKLFHRCEIEFY